MLFLGMLFTRSDMKMLKMCRRIFVPTGNTKEFSRARFKVYVPGDQLGIWSDDYLWRRGGGGVGEENP